MTAPVSLFDFDGTLLRRDSTRTLVAELAKRRPWRAVVAAPRAAQLRLARSADALQRAKCALVGALLRGGRTAHLAEAVERAAERVRAERRPDVVAALRGCVERGGRAIVVSASPGFFLRAALRDLPAEIVGTEFAVDGERYTGGLEGPVCFGAAKVDAVAGRIGGAVVEEAWSDSLADAPLMALARRRVWLCPPADADAVRRADPEGVIVRPAS